MRHRLYIVEGLPCSGKSSVSRFIAEALAEEGKVCFVDEGTGNHPADYEFHALSPEDGKIISLADVSLLRTEGAYIIEHIEERNIKKYMRRVKII